MGPSVPQLATGQLSLPARLHDAGMEEGAYWASIDCSGAPSEETSSQPGGQSGLVSLVLSVCSESQCQ